MSRRRWGAGSASRPATPSRRDGELDRSSAGDRWGHTTRYLDRELLAAAAEALGTTRTTDTVHAALREAVARNARARLLARDWSNFEDLLPEMRAPRSFLPQAAA